MKFVASFSPWLCGEIRGMEFRLWSAQSQRSLKAELQTYYLEIHQSVAWSTGFSLLKVSAA